VPLSSGFPITTTQPAGERSAEDANLPSMTNPPRRNIIHGVLSERYHLGGRVETDTVAMAATRQEHAGIQGRHRLEHHHGDDPSQTPSFSSLVARHEEASRQRALQSAGPIYRISKDVEVLFPGTGWVDI